MSPDEGDSIFALNVWKYLEIFEVLANQYAQMVGILSVAGWRRFNILKQRLTDPRFPNRD